MLAITDFNGTFVKKGDTVACKVFGVLVKAKVERVCMNTVFVSFDRDSRYAGIRGYISSRNFVKMSEE